MLVQEPRITDRIGCSIWIYLPVLSYACVILRFQTVTYRFPALILNDFALFEGPHLEILGVAFNAKLTLECSLRMVVKSVFSRIGVTRSPEDSLVVRFFSGGFLSCIFWLFYSIAHPVCGSEPESHLQLLDRVASVYVLLLFSASSLLKCLYSDVLPCSNASSIKTPASRDICPWQ